MLRQNKEQQNCTLNLVVAASASQENVFFGLSCNPLRGEEKRDEALRTCSWDAIAASAAEVFIKFSSRANSW